MNRVRAQLTVSPETFAEIFMQDTLRDVPHQGAPDCPLELAVGHTGDNVRKCEFRSELRQFALAAPGGHPCGEHGACPARTYLLYLEKR